MSQSVGATASAQAFEVLGAVMAKKQLNQEAQMTNLLVESAMQSSATAQSPSQVGNLGMNIDIKV
ncbi:hypothetical protein [Alkalimonas amylolytica]|uniref:Motility protein n=1 Tax=Alkalimonas amylolytica TaxID=152573 RepID=A0A1H4CMS7_ALKAM|nr:hypothetical protein [Alkalimonas amylolytica]SEA61623.1 hypothetical protein SAMN04488051_104237 [Alkalimonas amylolytica]